MEGEAALSRLSDSLDNSQPTSDVTLPNKGFRLGVWGTRLPLKTTLRKYHLTARRLENAKLAQFVLR